MSYEVNPNFAGVAPELGATVAPTVSTEGVSTVAEVPSTGGGSRVAKIIIIVVLVILIIVSIVLIFIFRGNYNTCVGQENPACFQLICPVNELGIIADPDCGSSAFRFDSSGKKICSTSRYATT